MRKIALYAIALLIVTAGCKKTEKGEDARWKSGVKTVEELKVLYPGFKAPLQEQYDNAKNAMDLAKNESDKDARIKKMSSANNLLTAGFVSQLQTVDTKKKELQNTILKVTGQASDQADRATAQQASDSAKKLIAQVEATLQRGAPSITAANVIVRKAIDDLQQADTLLGTAANMAQAKKNAANATAGTAGATPGAGAAAPDPAKEKWTCEHCGQEHVGTDQTCSNCGAPRPKAK